MFFDRGISILRRVVVGLLLVVAIVVMTRFLDENTPSHVWLGLLSLPFQPLITYLAILLLRSFQLSSTTEPTLGGIVVGAVMIGYIGAWSGLALVGTVTGGLLGGVMAHGLATGAVSPILAGQSPSAVCRYSSSHRAKSTAEARRSQVEFSACSSCGFAERPKGRNPPGRRRPIHRWSRRLGTGQTSSFRQLLLAAATSERLSQDVHHLRSARSWSSSSVAPFSSAA
jgi:hypothetical protein